MADVTVQVTPSTINLSPLGFYSFGCDYLMYAKRARKPKGRYSPVPYFLSCQAIELLLKAWLSAQGITSKVLREKYGHNLDCLLARSVEIGLGSYARITPRRCENIRRANTYYQPGKKFNYFDLRTIFTPKGPLPDLPNRSQLHRFGDALVKGIHDPVFAA